MSQEEVKEKEYDRHKKKVSIIDIYDGAKLSNLPADEVEKRYKLLRNDCDNINDTKGGTCIRQVRAGRSNYKCDACLRFEGASY